MIGALLVAASAWSVVATALLLVSYLRSSASIGLDKVVVEAIEDHMEHEAASGHKYSLDQRHVSVFQIAQRKMFLQGKKQHPRLREAVGRLVKKRWS